MGEQSTIGDRVKRFRARAKLSQLDLELAIGASQGSLSRIESDKVNPTKETLVAIAKVFDLNSKEKAELLGVRSKLPTQEAIQSAIEEVKDYLAKPGVLAYLLDDWTYVHASSADFGPSLGLSPEQVSKALGKNLYEIMFDPSYGIRDKLHPDYFKPTAALELARSRHECDIENSELLKDLMKLPDFKEVWEMAKGIDLDQIMSASGKEVLFVVHGQEVKMRFSREMLKRNPRFELFEYYRVKGDE